MPLPFEHYARLYARGELDDEEYSRQLDLEVSGAAVEAYPQAPPETTAVESFAGGVLGTGIRAYEGLRTLPGDLGLGEPSQPSELFEAWQAQQSAHPVAGFMGNLAGDLYTGRLLFAGARALQIGRLKAMATEGLIGVAVQEGSPGERLFSGALWSLGGFFDGVKSARALDEVEDVLAVSRSGSSPSLSPRGLSPRGPALGAAESRRLANEQAAYGIRAQQYRQMQQEAEETRELVDGVLSNLPRELSREPETLVLLGARTLDDQTREAAAGLLIKKLRLQGVQRAKVMGMAYAARDDLLVNARRLLTAGPDQELLRAAEDVDILQRAVARDPIAAEDLFRAHKNLDELLQARLADPDYKPLKELTDQVVEFAPETVRTSALRGLRLMIEDTPGRLALLKNQDPELAIETVEDGVSALSAMKSLDEAILAESRDLPDVLVDHTRVVERVNALRAAYRETGDESILQIAADGAFFTSLARHSDNPISHLRVQKWLDETDGILGIQRYETRVGPRLEADPRAASGEADIPAPTPEELAAPTWRAVTVQDTQRINSRIESGGRIWRGEVRLLARLSPDPESFLARIAERQGQKPWLARPRVTDLTVPDHRIDDLDLNQAWQALNFHDEVLQELMRRGVTSGKQVTEIIRARQIIETGLLVRLKSRGWIPASDLANFRREVINASLRKFDSPAEERAVQVALWQKLSRFLRSSTGEAERMIPRGLTDDEMYRLIDVALRSGGLKLHDAAGEVIPEIMHTDAYRYFAHRLTMEITSGAPIEAEMRMTWQNLRTRGEADQAREIREWVDGMQEGQIPRGLADETRGAMRPGGQVQPPTDETATTLQERVVRAIHGDLMDLGQADELFLHALDISPATLRTLSQETRDGLEALVLAQYQKGLSHQVRQALEYRSSTGANVMPDAMWELLERLPEDLREIPGLSATRVARLRSQVQRAQDKVAKHWERIDELLETPQAGKVAKELRPAVHASPQDADSTVILKAVRRGGAKVSSGASKFLNKVATRLRQADEAAGTLTRDLEKTLQGFLKRVPLGDDPRLYGVDVTTLRFRFLDAAGNIHERQVWDTMTDIAEKNGFHIRVERAGNNGGAFVVSPATGTSGRDLWFYDARHALAYMRQRRAGALAAEYAQKAATRTKLDNPLWRARFRAVDVLLQRPDSETQAALAQARQALGVDLPDRQLYEQVAMMYSQTGDPAAEQLVRFVDQRLEIIDYNRFGPGLLKRTERFRAVPESTAEDVGYIMERMYTGNPEDQTRAMNLLREGLDDLTLNRVLEC